jgi:hypothetical protein
MLAARFLFIGLFWRSLSLVRHFAHSSMGRDKQLDLYFRERCVLNEEHSSRLGAIMFAISAAGDLWGLAGNYG